MPFLTEPAAVRHFSCRVVDNEGTEIEMAELYVHHWLLFNGTSTNGGLCGNLPNIWGIGAELQNVVYNYPAPYAVVTTGKEQWLANLHFIRTTNVVNVQDCIECRCPDSDPPLHPHGEVNCCADGTQCYSMENSTLHDEKTYHLEYTVGYAPITQDTKPLTVFSLDVTSTHGTDCAIQYDVPGLKEGEIHTLSNENTMPVDMNITFIETHQHIGGLNFSIDHFRGGNKVGTPCSTAPVYTESGPDKGHLVDIPVCNFTADQPYEVKAGDVFKLTSVYGPRTLPGGNPWHAGVMGLVFLAAHVSPTADKHAQCLAVLHSNCGPPAYPSDAYCLSCAEQHRKALTEAGCTVEWVKAECAKNLDNGNIPPPDQVTGMVLHFTENKSQPDQHNVTLECPAGAWCSVAINWPGEGQPLMDGSDAYVWSAPVQGQPFALQRRTLGNHNQGTVVDAKYPFSVTTSGATTKLAFEITLKPPTTSSLGTPLYKRICILFAQGSESTTVLGYHGASRGFTCIYIDR
eukprot:CAMPEP_0175089406 /NCGR_PEP_ID=MMETSP0086_2-20121207/768_1 /TAXON_ID=136419 /ORGANISM="Unknown Unknown, Strain D1" /LENGTH=515 /DNA_ID=CAMNT_0016361911 /DNA_START=207 /DNA_END=1754 /DNA_ORIENTATION=+